MTNTSPSLPRPKTDEFYQFSSFRVPKYQIKFQNARKLADIPGYVWYSPAPLFLWGRFEEKNLADMVRAFGARFFWYRFDLPVFSGLTSHTDSAWNHTLWAAEEAQWPKLVDQILETVQFDIPGRVLFQYALQSVRITDPLSADISRMVLATSPVTEVKLFAVQSNLRQYALNLDAKFDLAKRPTMQSYKPSELHVKSAKILFAGSNLTQDNAFTTYRGILRAK